MAAQSLRSPGVLNMHRARAELAALLELYPPPPPPHEATVRQITEAMVSSQATFCVRIRMIVLSKCPARPKRWSVSIRDPYQTAFRNGLIGSLVRHYAESITCLIVPSQRDVTTGLSPDLTMMIRIRGKDCQ